MRVSERVIEATVRLLKEHRNKKKVVAALVRRKIPEPEAIVIVNEVHRALKANVRRSAAVKMALGLLGTAVFLALALGGGVLFYVALPISVAGFLWGLLQLICAVGYDLD